MIQMILFTKYAHGHRKQTYGYQRGKAIGEGLGLADTNYYI